MAEQARDLSTLHNLVDELRLTIQRLQRQIEVTGDKAQLKPDPPWLRKAFRRHAQHSKERAQRTLVAKSLTKSAIQDVRVWRRAENLTIGNRLHSAYSTEAETCHETKDAAVHVASRTETLQNYWTKNVLKATRRTIQDQLELQIFDLLQKWKLMVPSSLELGYASASTVSLA